MGKDVKGKIVVAVISYDPPRPEKVRLAQLHGAIGIVLHNYTTGVPELVPEGTCKPMWGNPTDEDFHGFTHIPVVGVSYAAGAWIRDALTKGRVGVRLRAQAERCWSKLILPIAYFEGNREPNAFTIFGGHYDSWSKGATDNASGNACTLELARVFSKYRNSLERSVMFVWWPAHEQGIMEGSTWFVDSYWAQLMEGGIAYLNVDSTGMIETESFSINASPVLAEFGRRVVREVLGEEPEILDLTKVGDQSFFGVGIPSISGRHHPDAVTLRRWGGVALGWWWHSNADTIDKVDRIRLGQALKVYAAWIWDLSNQPVLPFKFSELAHRFVARLVELEEESRSSFDLAELRTLAGRVALGAVAFDRETDELIARAASFPDVSAHNAAALRIFRELTPAGFQVTPRWLQDSYGLSDLKKFIPSLRAVEDLGRLQPGGHEFNLKYPGSQEPEPGARSPGSDGGDLRPSGQVARAKDERQNVSENMSSRLWRARRETNPKDKTVETVWEVATEKTVEGAPH